MFKLLCVCVMSLVAMSLAASIGSALESTTEKREIIPVLKFETNKQPDGSFNFLYEGGDKSFREETGVLQNADTEDETLEVSGSYRYIDADGQEIEVHYTAGKNGFVPIGTNIPAEISALAKAAADLPNDTELEDVKSIKRKARSDNAQTGEQLIKVAIVEEPKAEEKKPVAEEKPEAVAAEIPAAVKVDEQTA